MSYDYDRARVGDTDAPQGFIPHPHCTSKAYQYPFSGYAWCTRPPHDVGQHVCVVANGRVARTWSDGESAEAENERRERAELVRLTAKYVK